MSLEERKQKFIQDLKIDKLSVEEIVSKYYLDMSSYFFDKLNDGANKEIEIKRKISSECNVFQRDIVLTGSGQLGFSLKPDTDGQEVSYPFLKFSKSSGILSEDKLLSDTYYAERSAILEVGSIINDSVKKYTLSKKSKLNKIPSGSYIKAGSILDSGSDLDFAIVNSEFYEKIGNDLYSWLKTSKFDHRSWRKYNQFCKYYFKGWIRPDCLPYDYSYSKDLKNYFKKQSEDLNISGINIAIYKSWKYLFYYHQININRIRTKLISL